MKLNDQLKARRQSLGLHQKDMKLRIGMNQQQYQRVEAGGNPRLDTLELIAEGLDADLMLIPKDRVRAVLTVLRGGGPPTERIGETETSDENPWSDILD